MISSFIGTWKYCVNTCVIFDHVSYTGTDFWPNLIQQGSPCIVRRTRFLKIHDHKLGYQTVDLKENLEGRVKKFTGSFTGNLIF